MVSIGLFPTEEIIYRIALYLQSSANQNITTGETIRKIRTNLSILPYSKLR